MWLEIKTDLMWWWWVVVVGVEGENRNKLGACQFEGKITDVQFWSAGREGGDGGRSSDINDSCWL